MRMTLFGLALAVLAGLASTAAYAQTVPNLSGTWVLQLDKSDFGMGPAPQSRTDVYDHQEPKLNIKRTVVSETTGETTSNLVYVVDGKPYKNMVGTNELTSTLNWEGQTLVMVSTVTTPQGEATITDRISLSADGKTMNQARTLSIGGQQISQTMVLAKQP
ncbi:MAG TPA: hypothetical protein VGQ69_09590 [Gemmatimonadales bacterium]|jgi:hypothetical protein|nr:hypothetical protein [Gemmatimonadales bacterium]